MLRILIKKLYLIIFISAILSFLWLATIFGDASRMDLIHGVSQKASQEGLIAGGIVGAYGDIFASLNISIFGYLGYIYLPLLIIALFKFYKDPLYSSKKVELTIGYILGFIAILLLQGIIFDKGEVAKSIIVFLNPFIGIFGIALLSIALFLISYSIILEKSFYGIFNIIKSFFRMCLMLTKKMFFYIKIKLLALKDKVIKNQDIDKSIINLEYSKTEVTKKSMISNQTQDELLEAPLDNAYLEPKKDLNLESTHVPQGRVIDRIEDNMKNSINLSRYNIDDARAKEEDSNPRINPKIVNIVKNSLENIEKLKLQRLDITPPKTQRINETNTIYNHNDFLKDDRENSFKQEYLLRKEKLQDSIRAKSLQQEDSKDQDKENLFSQDNLSNSFEASKQASKEYKKASKTEEENESIKKEFKILPKDYIREDFNKEDSIIKEENILHKALEKESYQTKQDYIEQDHMEQNYIKQSYEEASHIKQDYAKQNYAKKEYVEKNSTKQDYIEKDLMQEDLANKQINLLNTLKDPIIKSQKDSPNKQEQIQDIKKDIENKESLNKKDLLKAFNANLEQAYKASEPIQKEINIQEKEISTDTYTLPPLTLLAEKQKQSGKIDELEVDSKIKDLLNKLQVFKIQGDIVRVYSGPVVTTFEFRPEPNVKVNKVLSLQDDLAMTLKAKSIRIQAPIPGKDVLGIEIPNSIIETIYLKEILSSNAFLESSSPLSIALGKDIVGNPFVANLEKLPHLLVAGTTGSGKSVGVNAIIISLLYRNSPKDLRLIMIDPKKVEFEGYEDIPHLITPVINNPEKAVLALSAATKEMDKRYELIAKLKSKNIISYNEKAKQSNIESMPYLVIIIDELADLIMTGGKDVEFSIARIAQMGRACGMHLIVATQRSSTDVVTGLIKTNLPSRISYKVGNRIDSKVILDNFGAERLLGNGDGLFSVAGGGLVRIHAPWISEGEIEQIIGFIKSQSATNYDEDFLSLEPRASNIQGTQIQGDLAELLAEARQVILNDNKTSISNLQRRLGIGYNKASILIEALEAEGFLSSPNSKNERSILA